MNTLSALLKDGLRSRGQSTRSAARQMGVAHTTLIRIQDGKPADVNTLIKICAWLGVSPASVLNADGMGTDVLAAQIATVLESDPKLAAVFSEAMARIISGEMQPDTLRDLAAYAAYRLGIQKESEPNETGRGAEQ
jgi:transcriptional regulator with XRE-family HTH domain